MKRYDKIDKEMEFSYWNEFGLLRLEQENYLDEYHSTQKM
jgi:hypothetical protein